MSDIKINKSAVVFVVVFILLVFFYVFSGRISVWRNEETVKISEILSAAIDLAKKGGEKVVEIRNSESIDFQQLSKGKTKEGKDEFVTAGDHMSHEIITSGLKVGWPSLKYQSEETDNIIVKSSVPNKHNDEVSKLLGRDEEVPLSEVLVWIDPLDATQEYTEGKTDKSLLKYVTVMVCVVVKDTPVAGVVYQAFEKKMYWGWVGHGTSDSVHELLQQRKQQITNEDSVNIVISRSHSGDAKDFIFNKAFSDSGDPKVYVNEAAGSGYKVLEVLRGADDVYFHLTLIKKWDLCAGNALLYAVNGNMTTRNADVIDYSLRGSPKNEHGVVATLAKHDYFVNKLKEP